MNKAKHIKYGRPLCLMIVLSILFSMGLAKTGLAAQTEDVKHFKMISSVEYTGKTQFKSQVETLLTVRKQFLPDGKVQYFLSTKDFDLVEGNLNSDQQSPSKEVSFVIDRKTKLLSGGGEDLALFTEINNQCIRSLEKVTMENIGKTWEQSFNLSFIGNPLASELKFNLTAIQLDTKVFGEMIAVRALSEPFIVNITKENGEMGSAKSKIGAVYLFDPEIEDIYMSISVFETTTKDNGFKEQLRREVATYQTNVEGIAVDLSGLGKEFEKLARKVGLKKKSIKVVNEAPLVQWVQSEGTKAAQMADICAAIACEGAPNPIAIICIPAARTVALQSAGKLTAISQAGTVSSLLSVGVPAVGAMKIAVAPAFMGGGMGTAGAIGGGTAGAVAVGGGGSSGSSSARTESSP